MNTYQSKNLTVITISRFTIERIQLATRLNVNSVVLPSVASVGNDLPTNYSSSQFGNLSDDVAI